MRNDQVCGHHYTTLRAGKKYKLSCTLTLPVALPFIRNAKQMKMLRLAANPIQLESKATRDRNCKTQALGKSQWEPYMLHSNELLTERQCRKQKLGKRWRVWSTQRQGAAYIDDAAFFLRVEVARPIRINLSSASKLLMRHFRKRF